METQRHKLIGIIARDRRAELGRLFGALSSAFRFRFEIRQSEEYDGLDAVVLLGADRDTAYRALGTGISCYTEVAHKDFSRYVAGEGVRFSQGNEAPWPFAGEALRLSEPVETPTVYPSAKEEVVASVAGQPVWSQGTHAGRRATFVSLRIPELVAGEVLFHHFSKRKFLNLLPLIDFIKYVSEERSWIRPGLRACLMFDDPNLHQKTYGFINFEKLALHATANNYHAAIATIPLDAWHARSSVAKLFRENSKRLSLLIHGNNHIKRELARSYSDEARVSLLRQALERIAALESKTGLEVSRVMAPPHGACSEEMIVSMKSAGFEAACVSNGSLRAHNLQARWLETLGFGMTNIIRGFPVMSRFPMAPDCRNDIYLAAYLDRAIIPIGHHEEASSEMRLLRETAATINRLGNVMWANARTLSRANYFMRFEDDRLYVRMRSRRIELTLPTHVRELVVEGLGVDEGVAEQFTLIRHSGENQRLYASEPTATTVHQSERVRIICGSAEADTVSADGFRILPLWPFLRRQGAECRDRLKPFLRRESAAAHGPGP